MTILNHFFFMSILNSFRSSSLVIVQGASRGIGLGIVRHLLQNTPAIVVGTSRNPESSSLAELASDQNYNGRLFLFPMDIANPSSIESSISRIRSEILDLNPSLRFKCLLNASGILHKKFEPNSGEEMPERTYKHLDADFMMFNFAINAIGPMLVMKECSKLIDMHYSPSGDEKSEISSPIILASLSARVGSITDNQLGGWYSYRMSKAALNMGIKTFSRELKQKYRGSAISVALHPGTVETDLFSPFKKGVKPENLFSKNLAASQLIHVISSLQAEDNGKFFSYDRSEIPW